MYENGIFTKTAHTCACPITIPVSALAAQHSGIWLMVQTVLPRSTAPGGSMSNGHTQRSSLTILVVDDDDLSRKLYYYLLAAEGYHVVTAITGQDALVQAAAHPIDAMLLDYHLPDITGVELCRHLRGIVAGTVPILVITADPRPTLEADARATGVTAFWVKPVDFSKLFAQLRALIPSRGRR